MKYSRAFLAPLTIFALSAKAWGPLGHSTVAAVALQYLSSKTLDLVQKILCHEGLAEESLVTVANWADSYRRTKEGSYSYPYHFIDVEDDPLVGDCNVDMARDCSPKGCIVTAIANYTRRAANESLGLAQNAEAIRFLTHFFGDIHQPLHAEAIKRAGNNIPVLFNGQTSNLHRAWDADKIQDFFGNYTLEKSHVWAKLISREIDSEGGIYHEAARDWLACQDVGNPEACALQWAIESNRLNCEVVLATDPTNQELNGGFYPDWMLSIEKQIAKAGVRLAAWLNLIFTETVGFGSDAAAPLIMVTEEPSYRRMYGDLR
ncbi:hypothetical protein FRB98_006351 [Tulasnella sp. 332]|nr:hypothetical protein FRB98_006351 [Tulasnella sp. 332]